MPMLDMPVSKLEEYRGINPKPDDFDDYWEKALGEMWNTDPDVELKARDDFKIPGAECFEMYFTGVNGARIYAQHLRPANIKDAAPAVLMFHGYSGSSGSWVSKLKYVLAGMSVFALDVRGQGGKSEDVGGVHGNTLHGHIIRGLAEDDPQKLMFRDIFLDTAMLARIAMDTEYVDETRVYAEGGSQGGGLTLACVALVPQITRAVAACPFLSDYKRVWEMDLDKDAYGELREYFRNFDPRHEREDEIFTKLGYVDVHNLAPRIKADTVICTGLLDNVCPPSTQYAAYNNMTCKKKHLIYPDFKHEDYPGLEDFRYKFFVNGTW